MSSIQRRSPVQKWIAGSSLLINRSRLPHSIFTRVYQHFDASVDLVMRCESATPCTSFAKLRNIPESIDDFDVFYTGGRLYF